MNNGHVVAGNVVEISLEEKLKKLEQQLADKDTKINALEAKQDFGAFNPLTTQASANSIIKQLVEEVLGKRFQWSLLGFGKHQFLEVYVPADLEDPTCSWEKNKVQKTEPFKDPRTGQVIMKPVYDEQGNEVYVDGRPRFRKPHPKAGEVQGDVRTIRVQDEDQLRNALERVKKNIIQRFVGESKNLPNFL